MIVQHTQYGPAKYLIRITDSNSTIADLRTEDSIVSKYNMQRISFKAKMFASMATFKFMIHTYRMILRIWENETIIYRILQFFQEDNSWSHYCEL